LCRFLLVADIIKRFIIAIHIIEHPRVCLKDPRTTLINIFVTARVDRLSPRQVDLLFTGSTGRPVQIANSWLKIEPNYDARARIMRRGFSFHFSHALLNPALLGA